MLKNLDAKALIENGKFSTLNKHHLRP